MSKFDSKICVVVLAATFAVGACGPVADSASKFTGIGGGSSAPTQNVNATSDTASVDELSTQQTEILSEDEFKQKWPEISVRRPSMLFEESELAAIKSSFQHDSAAEFQSSDARVEGSEATLAGPKSRVRIFLILKSASKAKSLQLGEIELRLVWMPKAKDKDRHWKLVIQNPSLASEDPAIATNAEIIRKTLLKNLSAIAIEFEAENHSDL